MEKNNKKRQTIYVLLSVIVFIVLTCITVLILGSINSIRKSQESEHQLITKGPDNLLKQAVQALKDNSPNKAKLLYATARQIYLKRNDNDAIADIDYRLFLINNPIDKPTLDEPTTLKLSK